MRRKVYFLGGIVAAFGGMMYLRSAPQEVQSGAWWPSGVMSQARTGASAVRLPDGSVLITGGTGVDGVLNTAELFSQTGSFNRVAPMMNARNNHVAVALEDGRVLIAGGKGSGEEILRSAELYDPSTKSWRDAGVMSAGRVGHTATLLSDGRILIAGGQAGDASHDSLEIFDPARNRFETVPATLSSARTRHSAALLPDGRVLLAGGFNGSITVPTTDIFDPKQGTVTHGPEMVAAREGFTVTPLLDGRILVTGGSNGAHDLGSAEIFDPTAGKFVATGDMTTTRRGHLAFLLPDNNRVLLVGGDQGGSSELFTPWRGTFQATGNLNENRSEAAGAPAGRNGTLVLAGGRSNALRLDSSKVYRYATLKTDKEGYNAGETVNITGTGWQPRENVTLRIDPLGKNSGGRMVTVVADPAGNISSNEYQQPESTPGQKYSLTAFAVSAEGQLNFASAKPGANEDDCANGAQGQYSCNASDTNLGGTVITNWSNGNLNSSKAHYIEGDSVPFRFRMDTLIVGKPNTITIGYDTTKAGLHAFDYLTTYNRTVTLADPCHPVALTGCNNGSAVSSTMTIPAGPNTNNQIPGVMALWGGTITKVSTPAIYVGDYTTDSSTQITITFTPTGTTAVLAFSAHIATRADWGVNGSAVSITGSPFHVRLLDIDQQGGGNQDHSVDSGAVVFPGSITIVKKVPDARAPQNTSFSFTSSSFGNFSLVGTQAGNSKLLSNNIQTFTTYTATETMPDSNWQLDTANSSCTGTTGYSFSSSVGTATVSIPVSEGQLVTCTFANMLKPATLTLSKTVTNKNGGSAKATDFILKATGPDTIQGAGGASGSVFAGFLGSTYTLSETGPSGYSATAWVCNSVALTGSTITLTPGQSMSCSITNNDTSATLTVIKHVVNDNGGSAVASSFKITVTCGTAQPITGAESPGTPVTCPAGPYSVTESDPLNPSGYTASFSSGCSGTLVNGGSATCTVTNTSQKAHLKLVKSVVNNYGTPVAATSWNLTAAGTTTYQGPGGIDQDVKADTYTLSESGTVAGYTNGTTWTCTGTGTQGDSTHITLALGQKATCTITNTAQAPHLKLVKNVVNGFGTPAAATSWNLTADRKSVV